MPSRKVRTTPASSISAGSQPEVSLEAGSFFPFARYTSVVGVHTSLLAFSALLLPTTPTSLLTKGVSLYPNGSATAEDGFRRDIVGVLTENPVRTVAWMCVGSLILQGWWASWLNTWSIELRGHANAKGNSAPNSAEMTKQMLERRDWGNQRLAAFGRAISMTLAASIAFHVVTVLFGAPISSHPLHTFLMNLLLAILAVLPPAYVLGLPSTGSDSPSLVSRLTWIRLFAELSPRTPIERALVYPAAGAAMGCWVGAIPIGLDWERSWQAWPLTPAFGAMGGYIVGSLIALVTSATFAFAQVGREARDAQAQASKAKRS
ncbi:GPI biosynthesis protein family Pig-F-domain-containing protein [Trametes punicea]|nr:GPI biosynthesis protein family Pig-F-domain-containing protein [Trametes punicea]